MYSRVITTQSPPVDDAGPAMDFIRTALLPASQAMDGYRGYIALVDKDKGRSITVTLWDDEESERRSDEASRESRQQAVRATGGEVVSVEKFVVAVADLKG
jgi:heme-degrading monooxygenase HmoA